MTTHLTPSQMKQFVRDHFNDFVNNKVASAIRKNMTADFYDHDGPGGEHCGIEGDEQKLGPEGPKRLVIPEALAESTLHVDGTELNIVEFGEGESRHMACLHIPDSEALLSADMVYNDAHPSMA